MQRSLVQVAGVEENKRNTAALLDYIRARQGLTPHGCPLLMIYPFLRVRKLPSEWLVRTLKELHMNGSLREKQGCYYSYSL